MKTKSILALLLVLCLALGLGACAKSAPQPASTQQPAQTQQPAATKTPEAPAETPEAPAEPAASTEAPAEPAGPETVSFTDDAGRTLELPGKIERIAVTGPMSQIVVFSLAPELLVGVANAWDPGAEGYFDPRYYNLPVLGQLYGGKGELNLEVLLAAGPQLVLDVGEAKKSIAEDLDGLTAQTGIPFVHIDASTGTMAEAYRRLGGLLGLEERAEELASYCEETWARAEAIMAAVGEDRAKILYLLGEEGLNVIAAGSYHGEIVDLIGDNLAVLDEPSSKGTGNETDMEQILLWDPDFIIFANGSVADRVGDDPVWQQLRAIREGHYAEAPFGPFNWMGFPPSVQRYLGILWSLKLLYPAQADYELRDEVERYFELFYHCSLTEEQYNTIIG